MIRRTIFTNKNQININTQATIAKTLYKQILKWTHITGKIPFDPIPPLTLIPPRVNQSSLQQLACAYHDIHKTDDENKNEKSNDEYKRLAKLLPTNSIIDESKLILPIENPGSVRDATRLIFALNKASSDGTTDDNEILKDRIDLGFDVLKSLNQLSEGLDVRKSCRESHSDRSGVLFHVGQVVQHKARRWRAIIEGWNKLPAEETNNPSNSSLTKKEYSSSSYDDENEVEYILCLDEGDAILSRSRVMGTKKAKQHELEAVKDVDLQRVRSATTSYRFDGYNSTRNTFNPGEVFRYEYPIDIIEQDPNEIKESTERLKQSCVNAEIVLNGVKRIATVLYSDLENNLAESDVETPFFVHDIKRELESIIQGNLDNTGDILDSSTSETSYKTSIQYLSALFSIIQRVTTLMWQRRTADKNKHRINFSLGDIVKHKKYDFRGIVTAWDSFPRTDVSRWDGLQDMKGNVNDMPFYHIYADNNDTTKAFGQQRPFRYVCQENLELDVESDSKLLDVDMDDDWKLDDNGDGLKHFVAPDMVAFQHGERLSNKDEDDLINKCLSDLLHQISLALQHIKDHKTEGSEQSTFSLDHMFSLLHCTDCLEDATIVEECIKEIWKVHEDQELRWELDDGSEALFRGDKDKAIEIFDGIISNDTNYYEAHNKKATCHYMLGEINKSILAAKEAYALEPKHFQALAGLGLAYNDKSDYLKATKYFRLSLGLHPWSPVSSRLCVCLDVMKKLELKEEDN